MIAASPLHCLHPSNALTYASLLAAVSALVFAADSRTGPAAALIASAVILDTFDGRFARLFRRSEMQRALGGQLDSLSDAIAFGIVPPVCVALASSTPLHLAWGAAAFLFAAAAISRLAFYNVVHEDGTGFVGVPAPVAALIWTTAMLTSPGAATSAAVFIATAILMVMPISIPRPRGLALGAFVCWPVLIIAAHVARSMS